MRMRLGLMMVFGLASACTGSLPSTDVSVAASVEASVEAGTADTAGGNAPHRDAAAQSDARLARDAGGNITGDATGPSASPDGGHPPHHDAATGARDATNSDAIASLEGVRNTPWARDRLKENPPHVADSPLPVQRSRVEPPPTRDFFIFRPRRSLSRHRLPKTARPQSSWIYSPTKRVVALPQSN